MPKFIDVLVKDISKDEFGRPSPTHGETLTLSYKSFLMLTDGGNDQSRFQLVGEIDKDGELVPGNPNLGAQHRTQVPVAAKSVERVAEVGQQPTSTPEQVTEVQQPKRRGPKPKRELTEV